LSFFELLEVVLSKNFLLVPLSLCSESNQDVRLKKCAIHHTSANTLTITGGPYIKGRASATKHHLLPVVQHHPHHPARRHYEHSPRQQHQIISHRHPPNCHPQEHKMPLPSYPPTSSMHDP